MSADLQRSTIADLRQQNDNLIAVLDAHPLDTCCRRLIQAFQLIETGASAAFPSLKSNLKAEHVLRSAIAGGDLQIWRIHNAREVPFSPIDLLESNIRFGIFKSFERPQLDMQGAKIWVKRADWETFLEKLEHPAGRTTNMDNVPPNRQLDHEKIKGMAASMRDERAGLSIGAAAASIVELLPPNPRTGKPRDNRNIERIIAPLWQGAS